MKPSMTVMILRKSWRKVHGPQLTTTCARPSRLHAPPTHQSNSSTMIISTLQWRALHRSNLTRSLTTSKSSQQGAAQSMVLAFNPTSISTLETTSKDWEATWRDTPRLAWRFTLRRWMFPATWLVFIKERMPVRIKKANGPRQLCRSKPTFSTTSWRYALRNQTALASSPGASLTSIHPSLKGSLLFLLMVIWRRSQLSMRCLRL